VNYYEELGLAENASADEIHRAYRNLARLLHPDQQSDESVRRLAEVQMKRLNRIHDTLGDPVERRKYDLSLRDGGGGTAPFLSPLAVSQALPCPRRRRGPAAGNAIRALTALIVSAAMCAYLNIQVFSPPQPVPVGRKTSSILEARALPPTGKTADLVPRRRVAPVSPQLTALRQDREFARFEQDPALEQLSSHESETQAQTSAENIPPPPEPPTDVSLSGASPRVPLSLPSGVVAGRLAGTWIYVPLPVAAASEALYPPEYVEVVIAEHNGSIRGRYRARYLVTDRAIPSEVRFQFEGEADRDAANLKWAGAGGARGEVRLRLVGDHSLEVNWSALELGSQMGLVSGTAVLTRRRDQ
jgi:curved DNA-binding protein CbpA